MKLLTILIISGLWSIHCFGQADSTVTPAADSVINKSTFTIGAVYSNNASYYGQRAQENIPYAAVAATYRLRSGIYFSGLAYRLLNDSGSFISAGNAGLGIGLKLSKRFSADLSYSHTFYPANSPFLQASNPDNASASVTYDNWLSTKINADYAFGKTNDVFITMGTGKQLKLGSITSKDIITISPSIDVTAGTQRFYQTYITEKRLRDSLLGIILTPVIGAPSSGSASKTTSTTQFNVLSYNFKCPLAYNRSSYLVEIDYQLSILSNKAQSGAGKVNSFFSASFYYQF
jgi:hypothetical protein